MSLHVLSWIAFYLHNILRVLLPLAVSLGGVVTGVYDKILRSVVKLAREVAGQDSLGAIGVALLGIERST